jgi:putative transposase
LKEDGHKKQQSNLETKVRKIDQEITNIRKDFSYKLSTKISKNHATVFVEDLKVKKGTLEKSGLSVQAKSELKRGILGHC